ncbi:Ectonucleoside triphosphate diphosphohydrolase 1, partial [Anabarilius grahami]
VKVKNPWHRSVVILLTAFIILGIIIMVSISVVQNKPLVKKYKYGIVLDAGSSHTSVFIYEWPAEKENNTGMVQQLHTCNVKGKGISSYYANPEGAGTSLQECMIEAKNRIPANRHNETPVYLGATAGMRLLKMEKEAASEKVLASVEHSLKTYPFSYQGARIISGQEEGAFGWITVNYLSKNLNKPTGTLGALDLGGASTQITFVPQKEIESNDNSIDFRLYGNDYHLYTHSFLCYGKDQVLKISMGKKLESTRVADKAFSAFFFVMDFLNLTSDSLDGTKQKLAKYCSTPWKEIVNKYPQIKQKYLSEYCFSGTYILTLLEDGYNFTSDNWKDISFIKKIGDSDAGWTLGYMLNLTNMIPAEAQDTPLMPDGGYITFMLLFTLLILVLLLMVFIYFRRSTRQAQKDII